MSDKVSELHAHLARVDSDLAELREYEAALKAERVRLQRELDTANGVPRAGNHHHRPRTIQLAVLSALASYSVPVTTNTLAANPDLTHYRRDHLMHAVSELHRTGQIIGSDRTSKGYLWKLPSQ